MILLSALLVVAALVLLLVGLIAFDGTDLIWASIAASLAAGLLLLIGVVQQRRRTPSPLVPADDPHSNVRTTSAPVTAPAAVGAGGQESAPLTDEVAGRDAAELRGSDVAPIGARSAQDTDPVPTAVDPGRRDADGAEGVPTAAQRVDERGSTPVVEVEPDEAAVTGPAVTSVPAGDVADSDDIAPGDPLPLAAAEVFVLPGRPRYHLSGCRFLATHADSTGMRLADAEAAGYTPCGVCRP